MTTTASIPPIVPADAIRLGSGRTLRFEGRGHGAAVSYFLVDNDPGQGPDLHRHPYPETWVVLEGEVLLTIGELEFAATAGDTATAPAGAWHRFVATGTGRLRMVCIHASDVIVQEFAE
ncbi:cupin domain-containing protein [Agromyces sp. NPDC056965]|uniref:cupin domain-containing protein n=1 Tax=Agromyces sp. NPDC056965 TaxID=3345983 RepID=UPI003629427A